MPQITPEVFKTISKPARHKIAKQLAQFFSILHKTPLSIAKKYEKRVRLFYRNTNDVGNMRARIHFIKMIASQFK